MMDKIEKIIFIDESIEHVVIFNYDRLSVIKLVPEYAC